MVEFVQSYGIWIVAGLMFVLMLWMHTGGHQHGGHANEPPPKQVAPDADAPADQPPETQHRGGAH